MFDGDEAGILIHPHPQGVERSMGGEQGFRVRVKRVELRTIHRLHEGLARREVAVKRGHAHPGRLRNAFQRHRCVAGGEEPSGFGDETFPVPGRIGAQARRL